MTATHAATPVATSAATVLIRRFGKSLPVLTVNDIPCSAFSWTATLLGRKSPLSQASQNTCTGASGARPVRDGTFVYEGLRHLAEVTCRGNVTWPLERLPSVAGANEDPSPAV